MESPAFCMTVATSIGSTRSASICGAGRTSIFGQSVQTAKSVRAASFLRWAMKIGIFYSTATSNTPDVADLVKAHIGDEADEPEEIGEISAEKILEYDALIVGTPTWNTGAQDQRSGTEWDEFLYNSLPDLDLAGRPVACFGLGDAMSYGAFFCDALEELHDCFDKSGAKMVGYTDTDYVEFEDSKAVRDAKFLGLALDYVNEGEEASKPLIEKWCDQVVAEMKA